MVIDDEIRKQIIEQQEMKLKEPVNINGTLVHFWSGDLHVVVEEDKSSTNQGHID